ncbi:hypothetical protein GA0070610_4749 [Micromonospora echinofusca]|uniref:PPE family protein n=1 Tax=Micromonospora echinofusca TaxID=47858 RepID=A0A1C5GH27_MICEH|nr:hypothetical protein [Micromonospora echinofusca]SCG18406.1 hypothetical protein GA0070610_4749 [Micromonospora echinofusca]
MIERGTGGRTSALTDWRLMDVASMWACLQDHDTTNHWKQVAGWRKVCDLARAHLSRLQEYRKGLAEAWPPQSNEAARAYIRELDELIDKVQRTHDAASANYTVLSAATQAISTTRAELKKIYETYAVKVQEKQTYDATLADPKAAMGSRVPDRPVTDADLERLNVQARGIMYGLSNELQQAQVMLRQPPPRPKVDNGATESGFTSSQAPAIPPIMPVPILPNVGTPSTRQPGSTPRQVTSPSTPGLGPILGGTGTGLAPHPSGPGLPTSQPTAQPNPSPGIGTSGLPTGVSRPGISGPVSNQPGQATRPNTGSVQPSTPPSTNSRPLPHGGLIGGTPGIGYGPPGTGNTQPKRVNPIGGLIGGGGAGTAPSGGAGSRPGGGRGLASAHGIPPIGGTPFGAANPMQGRQGHRERGGEAPRQWDPEHPWEVDQGVPPVVRPPSEDGPIDPGPAIGFNR